MNEPDTKSLTGGRSFLVWMVVLTAAGGVARFAGLGDRDFWFDESCTFIYVHHLFDWPEDSSLLVESTNLPYYIALRGWVSIFGDTEAAYRSMSALVATLAIPLLGFLARRMGGLLAGIICAAIVAFHPLHIHYAHEARAYAWWMLLLSIALFFLYEAGRRGRWRWWIAYGITVLSCLHLHYFTVYWVPATIAVVLIAPDRRRVFRQWLVTSILVGVGFVPYFLAAVWPAAGGGGSTWVAPHWEPITAIPRSLWVFLPAGGYPAHLRGLSLLSVDTVRFHHPVLVSANVIARVLPAIGVVAMVLLLIHRVWGLRSARLSSGRPPKPPLTMGGSRRVARDPNAEEALTSDWGAGSVEKRSIYLYLAALTLGPLVVAWLYSVAVRPNYLVGRYDLVAWPAFIVWLAVIVAHLAESFGRRASRPMARAICLPLLACSLIPIGRMALLKPPPSFHNVRAQSLAQLAGPDDLVIALSYDRDYLQYYLHRADFAGRIVSYPSWLDCQVGWVDTEADLAPENAAVVKQDAIDRVDLIDSVIVGGGRVWLLADSIEARGVEARTEINNDFLAAAAAAGYETRIVDEKLLILEFVGSSPP